MCYKEEVQYKNEEKLQKKFDDENIPVFIQRYFINMYNASSAINYWVAIKDLLIWFIDKNIIKKSNISDIVPKDFYEIESPDVKIYLRYKESIGMSPTTLETRKNIFKSFWNYLVESTKCPVSQNVIKSCGYRGISSNNRNVIKKLPSIEQLNMMEEKIKNKKDEFIRIRNITIFRLLNETGLRESELAGLDMSDLVLDNPKPYIKIIGKGFIRQEEYRIVYLLSDMNLVISTLNEWLVFRRNVENIVDDNAVFINKNGKRFTEDNIKSMFKTYGYGITPHMMRHWYATRMAMDGKAIFAQQQLGHRSQNTTINNYVDGSYGMESQFS